MTHVQDDDVFARAIACLDPQARLVRAWPLEGGISAEMTALEAALPGGETRTVVVRRHGSVDLARNPEIATHEARLLGSLHAAGLPVPRPLCVVTTGGRLPAPCLVLDYVAGAPVFDLHGAPARVETLARLLVGVHRVDLDRFDLTFLPRLACELPPQPAQLDEALNEGRIRDILAARTPVSCNDPVLLHGDFWPGNVLWQGCTVAAIVDWENAGLGDPLLDLSNSRLEMLWAGGAGAMAAFTAAYTVRMSHLDLADLPYWDLAAALRPAGKLATWGLAPDREAQMRRQHGWFVERAIEDAGL